MLGNLEMLWFQYESRRGFFSPYALNLLSLKSHENMYFFCVKLCVETLTDSPCSWIGFTILVSRLVVWRQCLIYFLIQRGKVWACSLLWSTTWLSSLWWQQIDVCGCSGNQLHKASIGSSVIAATRWSKDLLPWIWPCHASDMCTGQWCFCSSVRLFSFSTVSKQGIGLFWWFLVLVKRICRVLVIFLKHQVVFCFNTYLKWKQKHLCSNEKHFRMNVYFCICIMQESIHSSQVQVRWRCSVRALFRRLFITSCFRKVWY